MPSSEMRELLRALRSCRLKKLGIRNPSWPVGNIWAEEVLESSQSKWELRGVTPPYLEDVLQSRSSPLYHATTTTRRLTRF